MSVRIESKVNFVITTVTEKEVGLAQTENNNGLMLDCGDCNDNLKYNILHLIL